MGSGGRGAVLGWARREPKAEEAGPGRLGRTRRTPGDPGCHDPGREPGVGGPGAVAVTAGGVCAPCGGCGAENVRDVFIFFLF